MKAREMERQRLRARCCSLLLLRGPLRLWVLCVLYSSHANSANRCDRVPLCSACVGVLWGNVWCGNTPQIPEYRYVVAAATTSSTAEQQLQRQSTTHTAPSTMLKLHPASPPPHMAACLCRPSRGLRVNTDSPIGPCAWLASLVVRSMYHASFLLAAAVRYAYEYVM